MTGMEAYDRQLAKHQIQVKLQTSFSPQRPSCFSRGLPLLQAARHHAAELRQDLTHCETQTHTARTLHVLENLLHAYDAKSAEVAKLNKVQASMHVKVKPCACLDIIISKLAKMPASRARASRIFLTLLVSQCRTLRLS